MNYTVPTEIKKNLMTAANQTVDCLKDVISTVESKTAKMSVSEVVGASLAVLLVVSVILAIVYKIRQRKQQRIVKISTENQLVALGDELREVMDKNNALEKEDQRKQEEIARLKKEHSDEMDSLNKQVQDLLKENASLSKQIEDFPQEIERLKAIVIKETKQLYADDIHKLKKEKQDLISHLQYIKEYLEAEKNVSKDWQNKLNSTIKSREEEKQKIAQETKDTIEQLIAKHNQEIADLKDQLAKEKDANKKEN
ncbi:hypothetical protein NEMIN01_0467 [Nematocida minor]|uniref:uncharacterized protein n=1 Tax=Nematocida minor TaxID=1912983 RepID=UPI00221F1E5E|nr:uncharacterized protein NEMIN01_0467 [Nematocida minor]KAI5189404.1 hypothetical protein NEMIN01_0467 [Nematocida minor]